MNPRPVPASTGQNGSPEATRCAFDFPDHLGVGRSSSAADADALIKIPFATATRSLTQLLSQMQSTLPRLEGKLTWQYPSSGVGSQKAAVRLAV